MQVGGSHLFAYIAMGLGAAAGGGNGNCSNRATSTVDLARCPIKSWRAVHGGVGRSLGAGPTAWRLVLPDLVPFLVSACPQGGSAARPGSTPEFGAQVRYRTLTAASCGSIRCDDTTYAEARSHGNERSAAPLAEGTMTPTDPASGPLAPAARLTVAVIAACPFPARRGTPVRIQRLPRSSRSGDTASWW